MCDAGDVEDRVEIFEGVEAGVVTEGTFGAEFVEVDVAFEDDFAGRRNFQIDGFAFDEFDWSGVRAMRSTAALASCPERALLPVPTWSLAAERMRWRACSAATFCLCQCAPLVVAS
jgi:hypothetical protein